MLTTVLNRTIISGHALCNGGMKNRNNKRTACANRKPFQPLHKFISSLAEKFGISDTTLDILCGIEQLGRPCTQKELCEIWYLSKQTVNSCIKQLSEKGFIETKSSSNDFREKLLFLTPKGKELCARSAKLIYSAECAAFAKLSYEERRQLIVLTKKHVDSLENEFKKILESNL